MIVSNTQSGRHAAYGAPAHPCTQCIPELRSLVYAFLFFGALLLSLISGPSLLASEPVTDRWLLSASGGYAVQAKGSVVESGSVGLMALQAGINSGALYSPGITEIQAISPLNYSLPTFSLESRSFAVSLSRMVGAWEPGLSLGALDIVGRASVPAAFLDLQYFKISIPGVRYLPVTEGGNRFLFATDLFTEGFLIRHINAGEGWDLFAGGALGGGRGWLADSGPYLTEAHASLLAGAGYRFAGGSVLSLRAVETTYSVRTGPSSFVDRRDVLVNPRRGNLHVGRVDLSYGVPVF